MRRYKIFSLMLFLSVFGTTNIYAEVASPENVTVVELLIDAHKRMKKAEDLAILELGTIEAEQSLTQKFTTAYNQTRSTLNKRMSDVNSYLSLALQLTSVTTKCKTLVENYSDFTTTIYKHAVRKPFVLLYYTRANYELKTEVQRLVEMAAGFSASNLNILKATMQEKQMMLSRMELAISRLNRIINHNSLMCKGLLRFGLKEYHVKELIDSKSYKNMINEIVALWLEKSAES